MTEQVKELKSNAMLSEQRQGEVYPQQGLNKRYEKSFYIESYGCSMNFSDSEIVASILQGQGYGPTKDIENADLLLINTCSIREKAEDTVRKRLRIFDKFKRQRPGTLVGVLGCMAERLKAKFLEEERLVDMVVGPDAYRDLPALIAQADDGDKGVNVFLSREETYADIAPVRLNSNGVSAFISIMRGCNNMCSFCVVPYTRGRERSRDPFSIVAEAQDLYDNGFKEVTLLGQNVDSYRWESPDKEFQISFAKLMTMVADIHPDLRVRFSTSHPKDITDDVLYAIRDYENICNYIHLPLQSGSSRILELMNRTYSREWYQSKVDRIREVIPECAISSDMITGFCSETESEHQETLTMMDYAQYSLCYKFYYSERPGTLAAKNYKDDISLEVKKRRLNDIIEKQIEISSRRNAMDIGKQFKVLIEGLSKKSDNDFKGRNSQNNVIIFPKEPGIHKGEYVQVEITESTSATLIGKIVK